VYVGAKGRASEEVGMAGETIRLPASTTQAELLERLDGLNADPLVPGILVQVPLAPQIDKAVGLRRIGPPKDGDGVHPIKLGKLLMGDRDGLFPCTPAGVLELLTVTGVETHGRECVVIGRSNIVGKPMAALMVQDARGANCTVTICHRYTNDLTSHT